MSVETAKITERNAWTNLQTLTDIVSFYKTQLKIIQRDNHWKNKNGKMEIVFHSH